MIRRTLRRLTLCLVVLTLPVGAVAQGRLAVDPVLDALRLGEVLDILAEESRASGHELSSGTGGASWDQLLVAIHDPDLWEPQMRARVDQVLAPEYIPQVLGFLGSAQGRQFVELEISARRALMDDAVEAASMARVEQLRAEDAEILEQVARFMQVNDLVEANVVGALNANVAFLTGLQAGSGAPRGDVIADVWEQEPEIRASTEDWLTMFLTTAYAPMASEDLEVYIAFSESEAGQAFNRALFAAFDEMFVATSHATGQALGQMLRAEDL